ncbi:hypothetical protein [Pseudomonas sp. Marseille-QA0892]
MKTAQRLAAAVLFGSMLPVFATPGQAQEATLTSPDQAQYLEGLKRLYLITDERQALLAHTNALLTAYMLKAGYRLDEPNPKGVKYEVSLGKPGEILVREESRGEQGGDLAVRNRRFSLFGVDPFIRYECPPSGVTCSFAEPGGRDPMVVIVRDQSGADQLAKALSLLIRNVQRG